MVYLKNIYIIFTKHNSILRSIWINITQNGFILRISVVIWYHSLALPHFYNTVFGGKSAWLWLRQQSTQSHNVWFARTQCVLFFCFFNLFKVDFVSSFRLLYYCRGNFSRSDTKIANFTSNLRGRLMRGSLHFHTPYVFVATRFKTDCVIQNVHISNGCHIFSSRS